MKPNNINFDELDPDVRAMTLAMFQTAIFFKNELMMDEEAFLSFCKGVWESMMLNDVNELKEILYRASIEEFKRLKKGKANE